MYRWMIGLLMIAAIAFCGCDDKSDTPLPKEVAPEVVDTHPTTQQLLQEPRVPLQLTIMPLTVKAPKSWSVAVEGSSIMLQGPAPVGTAHIELARRAGSMSLSVVQATVAGAKADMAKDPEHIKVSDLRDMNGLKIYDKIVNVPAQPAKPPDVPAIGPTVQWQETIFVPHGDSFDACVFIFIDLGDEEYAADADFLHSILDSATFMPEQDGLKL
jgi:hypothetical protein